MSEWRCPWCGHRYKTHRSMSDWEQKDLGGEWKTLCNRCANQRLGMSDNPFFGLIKMRLRRKQKEAPC